jgi:tRNA-splicing ligase RtcB
VNLERLEETGPWAWRVKREPGEARAEAVLYGDAELLRTMDDKVLEQITNVARLPGLVGPALAMPDAHWGYGFPIGGVAAFDPEQGGVISAGGVGFDISCGIRCLRTSLAAEDLAPLAKKRQRGEMGTLGSGNHYLEVQVVERVHDAAAAEAYGLRAGQIVVSIHCGSRGLGHQIGTEFLVSLAKAAGRLGIALPDRELACAPVKSPEGEQYIGAMNAAINCALANRQILAHLARRTIAHFFPGARVETLFDVSHNTCKPERHEADGRRRLLWVHRKGATRAFAPGHPDIPKRYREVGQPVIIGGSMGTGSYVLAGVASSEARAWSSASHGAGRAMSRHQALRQWQGRQLVDSLRERGILIRTRSMRGVAEEAPGAYKDVDRVAEATEGAGLARRVAFLRPVVCVKG